VNLRPVEAIICEGSGIQANLAQRCRAAGVPLTIYRHSDFAGDRDDDERRWPDRARRQGGGWCRHPPTGQGPPWARGSLWPACGGPVRAPARARAGRSRARSRRHGAAGYASPGLHHQRSAIPRAFASLAGRPVPATPTHRRARESREGAAAGRPSMEANHDRPQGSAAPQFSGENRFLRCPLTRRLRRP
jgi:hypothetical protein